VMGMECNNVMSVKAKASLSGKANCGAWILALSVLARAWKRLDFFSFVKVHASIVKGKLLCN
jgi:hypothetical protein